MVILWVLSVGQLITWGLVYYTFPLFVVPMETELGWSRDAMFGALSAGLLVAGLCSIPVGAWIDKGHGRKLMTGGSLVAAAALLVWSKTNSLVAFYALWIVLGACQSVTLYEPGSCSGRSTATACRCSPSSPTPPPTGSRAAEPAHRTVPPSFRPCSPPGPGRSSAW